MPDLKVPVEKSIIHSVADLLKIVGDWTGRCFDADRSYPFIWYRGQSKKWKLLPGVLREPFSNALTNRESQPITPPTEGSILLFERTINHQFFLRAAPYLPKGLSLVEKYFIAQHHGLPTRLLDWTVFPLTALFFAVINNDNEDGTIDIINPNKFLCGNENVPKGVFSQTYKHIESLVDFVSSTELNLDPSEYDQVMRLKFVLPICPDHTLSRMMQQGARFTLFFPGADVDSCHFLNHVERFHILHTDKENIRKELLHLNVSESTIFCDLDSLAKEVKRVYKIRAELSSNSQTIPPIEQ